MKRVLILFCLLFSEGTSLLSAVGFNEQITGILDGFSSAQYYERMQTTNQINLLLATVTNCDESASCKLLKSAVLLELAEVEHDDSAYAEATNLCSSVELAYCGSSSDWRFFASRMLQLQALSLKGKYGDAFPIATNSMVIAPVSGFEMTTNIWVALFGHEIPAQVSLRDAFAVNAVDALLSQDKAADITSLTNGLTGTAMQKIEELISR